jgi:hypothetical protein
MADAVESANVVGYSQQTANATRNTMMAPTFLNVTFANKCTLADLSVTGYTAPVYDEKRGRWSGGTKGDFNLQFLTSLKEKLRLPIFGMMMALDWAGMMMQALLQALLLALKLLRHGYLLPYPISYHMKSWQ